jgi:hypothetical protein
MRSASFAGLGFMLVTFVSTVTAFGLGLYYPRFSSFDTPQMGFFSISVALAFLFASMVSGACGAFAVRGYTRFEDTKAGKSKRAEKTASFDTNGTFRLNSEGQLKWTPKSSIGKSIDSKKESIDPSAFESPSKDHVDPNDVESPSNDDVDPVVVDCPSNDSPVKAEM